MEPDMSLDHGTLNIPLSKRGDIDAQIDRYKAQQAAEKAAARKTQAQQTAEQREQAKALVASVSAEKLAALATKSGLTLAAARKKLTSMAHWEPKVVIAALAA